MHPFCQLCFWCPSPPGMTDSCSSTPCKPQQASPVKSSPKSSPKLLRDVHPLFVDSQTVEDLADDMDSDSDSDDLLPPFTTFTTARKAVLSLSSYIEKICGQWKKFSTSLNSDRRLSRLDSVIVRTGTVLQQHQGNLKNLLFWVALNNSLLIQTCLKQTISWSINKSSTRIQDSSFNQRSDRMSRVSNRTTPKIERFHWWICAWKLQATCFTKPSIVISEALQNHIGPWMLARDILLPDICFC